MYETIVTEDGRLAIVLRLPKTDELAEEHVSEPVYVDPITIDYSDPEPDSASRVIIIDLEEQE